MLFTIWPERREVHHGMPGQAPGGGTSVSQEAQKSQGKAKATAFIRVSAGKAGLSKQFRTGQLK